MASAALCGSSATLPAGRFSALRSVCGGDVAWARLPAGARYVGVFERKLCRACVFALKDKAEPRLRFRHFASTGAAEARRRPLFSPKTACRRVFRPGDGAASVLLGQGLRGVGAFRLGERAASVLFLAENRAAFCARHAVGGEKVPDRLLDGGDDVPAAGMALSLPSAGRSRRGRAAGGLIAAAVRLRRLSAVVHGRRSGVPPGIERRNGWRDGKGQSRIPLRQTLCPGLLYRHKQHNRPLRYCSSATLPFAESRRFVSARPAAIRISPGAPNAQATTSPSAPHCGGKRDVCTSLHRDATAVENLCAVVGRDVRRVAGCARHAVRRASPSLPLVPRRLCGDSTAASVRTLPPVRACKKRESA